MVILKRPVQPWYEDPRQLLAYSKMPLVHQQYATLYFICDLAKHSYKISKNMINSQGVKVCA